PFLVCLLAIVPSHAAAGQLLPDPRACRDDIVDDDHYVVRSVDFSARYLPKDALAAPTPPPGTPYTTALASDLIGALHNLLNGETVRDSSGGTEFQILQSISPSHGAQVAVNYVSTCVRVVPESECLRAQGVGSARCVDITVTAYALRVNTADVWSNLLD